MRAHLAPGHDGSGTAVNNYDFPDAQAGAGAIRSTANDMMRYLKANMGIDQSPLVAAMKLAQQPRSSMAETARIGLAWMTTGNGIVWHSGGTGGYRSFLGFTEDGRRGVVVLANTATELFDDLGFATLDSNAPLVPTYKVIVLPSASLDDYVGTYRLADKFLLTLFRLNDELFAQATGQSAVAIFPFAPNEFFAKVAGISMSFTRDPNGLVNGLVLHQNGDREAPKLSVSEDSGEPTTGAAMIEVMLLNDDHTPMEFVVEVLMRIFDHDRESAARTMLWVHSHGIGACGTCPLDIAAAKAAQVLEFARAHQHPLRCVTAAVRR
jgi:ATP-dependent Clp protease adapter protein ClpS